MSIEEPHHLAILTNYLVRPCPGSCANPSKCLFFHSPHERRRCPFSGHELQYCDTMCQRIFKGQACDDSCKFCHNFQELVYHPNRYKVSWCEQANCKGYNLCYQAHKPNEKLRNLSHFTVSQTTHANTFSTHLDLEVFKLTPCCISEPHNPKMCIYFHSSRDRIRKNAHTFELCGETEKDVCNRPESCAKAHNRVEQLYHPEKYKMKFCTFYPKKIHECEYSSYCSFAHSETDIKVELIHNYQRNEEFYMYSFKTVWCPFILQHDKALCVYAHNWQDFRRKPREFQYNSIPCTNWKSSNFILSYEEGGCKNLLSCNKCHGWKEIEYHPNTYKMKPCSLGRKCTKPQDCPFYHSSKDKRLIEASPLKEVSNHVTGVTPHPQKQFLSPEAFKGFQTPMAPHQPAGVFVARNNVEQIRQINSTTEGFALHRGAVSRASTTEEFAVKRGTTGRRLEGSEFFSQPEPFSLTNTPVRGVCSFAVTPQSKDLDSRVLQFLSRHRLKHLASKFKGTKWEDLDTFHLDDDYEDEAFRGAWEEEKEDQDQLDELIINDIALFTGQKTGNTPDLKKFALQEDIEDFIVTFPKSLTPSVLKCPITKMLMRDPAVFSLDGRTYERSAIIKHIQDHYPLLEAQQLVNNLHSDKHIREELLNRFT